MVTNNGFVGVPVGGVIPWIGGRYGVPLPENYRILNGNTSTSGVPTESPFRSYLSSLPNMNSNSFHCINGSSGLFGQRGSNSVSVTIGRTNLPTNYTYSEVIPSYTVEENAGLSSSGVTYNDNSSRPISTAYYPTSNPNVDGGSDRSGSGQYFMYTSSYSYGTSTLSHNHSASWSHNHKVTPTGGTYTKNGYVNWGSIGSGNSISIPTSVTDLARATCYFVIRLW